MTEIEILSSIGINISKKFLLEASNFIQTNLKINKPSLIAEEIYQLLLVADLNEIDCYSLPPNIQSLHMKQLAGPFFLQIETMTNIATNSENRQTESGPRTLKILFTDGQQQVVGIEVKKIPSLKISMATSGLKVCVWDVVIRRGVLLLNENCIKVLGGSIDRTNNEQNFEISKNEINQETNKVLNVGPTPINPSNTIVTNNTNYNNNSHSILPSPYSYSSNEISSRNNLNSSKQSFTSSTLSNSLSQPTIQSSQSNINYLNHSLDSIKSSSNNPYNSQKSTKITTSNSGEIVDLISSPPQEIQKEKINTNQVYSLSPPRQVIPHNNIPISIYTPPSQTASASPSPSDLSPPQPQTSLLSHVISASSSQTYSTNSTNQVINNKYVSHLNNNNNNRNNNYSNNNNNNNNNGNKTNLIEYDQDSHFDYDVCEVDPPLNTIFNTNITSPIINSQGNINGNGNRNGNESDVRKSSLSQSYNQSNQQLNRFTQNNNIYNVDEKSSPYNSKYDQERDKNQLSGESIASLSSEASGVTPFKMSVEDRKKNELKLASPQSYPITQIEPVRRLPQRVFIDNLIKNKNISNNSQNTTYNNRSSYIEGATIGIEALKVEFDPLLNQDMFYVVIQFEETESLKLYPIQVKSEICCTILNMTPTEYKIMLKKLSNKNEKNEFKIDVCTRFAGLAGKFYFQVETLKDTIVGTIIEIIN